MITSLYLLGACTGRSAGFSFEYVSRGMPELVEEIAAVGDQSPGIGIIALHAPTIEGVVDARLIQCQHRDSVVAGPAKLHLLHSHPTS